MVNRDAVFVAIDKAVEDLKSILSYEDLSNVDNFALSFSINGNGYIRVDLVPETSENASNTVTRRVDFLKEYKSVF